MLAISLTSTLVSQFAKKFPGYTSSNLCEKGVHEVSQRRFVLVAADHPSKLAIMPHHHLTPHSHIRILTHMFRPLARSCLRGTCSHMPPTRSLSLPSCA